MHSTWILIISMLFLWNPGCSSEKKDPDKAKTVKSTEDTLQVKSDTIPTPDPPPQGLAPGQAKIEGEIISFHDPEETSNGVVTIKVKKVLGYGPSTPPITVSDSMEVTSGSLDPKKFKIGKIVSAILSYQPMLGDSGKASRWTLVKLEKD